MNNWTPITPRTGGLVHMTSLKDAGRTQCGKSAAGWMVSTDRVSCASCKEKVHLPVKGHK